VLEVEREAGLATCFADARPDGGDVNGAFSGARGLVDGEGLYDGWFETQAEATADGQASRGQTALARRRRQGLPVLTEATGVVVSSPSDHPAGGTTESAAMVSTVRVSARPEKFGYGMPRYFCEISSMLSAPPSVVAEITRPRTAK
jgi:hypothetical protein